MKNSLWHQQFNHNLDCKCHFHCDTLLRSELAVVFELLLVCNCNCPGNCICSCTCGRRTVEVDVVVVVLMVAGSNSGDNSG